jgi:hypothetical protein
MKILQLRSLILAAAFFVGNANAEPPAPAPETLNLEPVKAATTTVLPTQVVEVIKAKSWALADVEQTLFAGRYTATKENALGTFYQADNYAFANKYRRNQYHLHRGGFWLPKSGEFKPQLFVMAGGRPMIVADIAGMSAEALGASTGVHKPLTIGVSSAAGAAGVNIANSIVSAIVEAEYAKPQRETMMGPVTNPEILKVLTEAVAQLKPVATPPATPATP